ncbi:interferon-induced protein 44-like [Pangasianodon hypophthalmus]|uniref:interferon-induced protein 44-like n=1 Tax=Pangasianodon hypophthalmus TaxID=310915 RepID=UPI002307ED86|nr:interferon-induced protein 44-like [Pangasianodon hypophthalmus]
MPTPAKTGNEPSPFYKTHYIEGKDGCPLPFVFNDVMGLEVGEAGAHSQDIIRALSGILQEGYNFDPASSASMKDLGYRSNPSLEDQTFCLVNIMAADIVSVMKQGVIEKMKKIREAATQLNMPQVVILTRPDLACPLVKQDIKKIYISKKIKEKMEECKNLLGIPVNHIFPVKNYHEEIETDDGMDALILKALDQIVNIACDAVKRKTSLNFGEKSE